MNPNAGKYFSKDGERHPNILEHERIAQLLVEEGYLKWEQDGEGEFSLHLAPRHPKRSSRVPKSISFSVEWGYELHSVSIPIAKWAAILAGEALSFKSVGWYEGKKFPVWWSFSCDDRHSVYVSYGDEGLTGFEGDITNGYISEEH